MFSESSRHRSAKETISAKEINRVRISLHSILAPESELKAALGLKRFQFIVEKNIILRAEPRVSHDLMLVFFLNTLLLSIEEVTLSYLSTVDNTFNVQSGKLVLVSRGLDK